MSDTTLEYLHSVRERRGAGYLPLLDPDRLPLEELERRVVICAAAGADAVLVGTSLMFSSKQAAFFERVKKLVDIPVICFPGSASQVSPLARSAHSSVLTTMAVRIIAPPIVGVPAFGRWVTGPSVRIG